MCKYCDDKEIARLIDLRDKWIDDYENADIGEDAEDELKSLALFSEDVYDRYRSTELSYVVDFALTMYNGIIITGFNDETDKLDVLKASNIKYCPHCGRKLD